mmetsp:Transcript_91086/g.195311  ORF Transcript_91086/g.195311 Transcript_91086/m.195311 type:complete len:87 (+) Transcript_91086:798-1058(+)
MQRPRSITFGLNIDCTCSAVAFSGKGSSLLGSAALLAPAGCRFFVVAPSFRSLEGRALAISSLTLFLSAAAPELSCGTADWGVAAV